MSEIAERKSQKSQLAVIFFTVFIYLLGFGIVIPIIPLLSRDFGATPAQSGALLSVYSLMQFLFSPFWGRLSDRVGRRRVLLGCLLGEGLTYILFAFSRDLQLLFVARILAGFFGASLSTASAAISDITPPNERSKGMALIGVAFGLGFMFGPALGGLLATWGASISAAPHYGTSFAMCWVAAICFATFLYGIKYLPETLNRDRPPAPRRGRFTLLSHFFSQPVVGVLMSVFFITSFAMSAMETSLVLYMKDHFGWGIRETSFGFAYIGVMMVLTQGLIVRRLLPKVGERTTLRWGLLFFALGLGGIAFAPTIGWMAVTMTFLALGTGLSNPSITGSISLLSNPAEQGAALGATQSLASLGRIVGPVFGGWMFEKFTEQSPFLLSGGLAILALAIIIKMGGQVPNAAQSRAKE